MNVGELEIKYPTAKEDMPSPSPNVLTWSEVQQHYELSTQEQPAQGFIGETSQHGKAGWMSTMLLRL